MTGKILGKITSAEFGMIRDREHLFGLQLYFKLGDGTSVGDGGSNTVNISKECHYEEGERNVAMVAIMDKTHQILKDAKVKYVSELVGKPVEVTIENNTFKNFRILTEVL